MVKLLVNLRHLYNTVKKKIDKTIINDLRGSYLKYKSSIRYLCNTIFYECMKIINFHCQMCVILNII